MGMFNLGQCYRAGRGVPQDAAKATALIKQAAAAGNDAARELMSRFGLQP